MTSDRMVSTGMSEITIDLPIQKRGTSLTLTVTKLVRLIEADQGDILTVTLRKKQKTEEQSQ